MSTTFLNEPIRELRRSGERAPLLAALDAVDRRLPIRVPTLVGGRERHGDTFASVDPTNPSYVVAEATESTRAEVDDAVALARGGFSEWRSRTAAERGATLQRAAGLMRARRDELAALAVREAAKPWAEADADICEAIDFLEYYALHAVRLAAPVELVQPPGERNAMRYVAVGVAAVIAPWNFCLAIPTGMVAAALAVGNAAILKPAEQTPACGLAIVRILHEAGVPVDALALLPGHGPVGAQLVEHPDVSIIAFTGSGEVGQRILQTANTPVPGQRRLKRVVAEMGGKNTIIVDSDADLDEAVPAILYSAFGFAGQKCSAADRLLVHSAVHDALLDRLRGAMDTVVVGRAGEFGGDVSAVIEREAQTRLLATIEEGRRTGTIVAQQTDLPDGDGFWVPPTLIADLPADSPLLREEFFGPLLTIEQVGSVGEACDIVDALPQALTGGLMTRNPATVGYVVDRTPVGNLYVNRGITGATVGRQPFGGNRMSGTSTKAGGPDYLLHFVEPRVVTENTTRHGLTL